MRTHTPLRFVLVALAACGSDAASPTLDGGTTDGNVTQDAPATPDAGVDASPPPTCSGLTLGPTGTLASESVVVGGGSRTYVLVVPKSASAVSALPIVFVFHGDGGTGAGVRAQLALEAPAGDGAIFVYPNGVQRADGWWDLDKPATTNPDIAFFDAMLATLKTRYCVDAKRVFVTGFSRGGFFTNHLGCHRGDVLRAIAPQSGGGPYAAPGGYNADGQLVCPTPPVPALIIHGNADGTVKNDPKAPEGGWQAFYHWAYWNHAAPRATYDFATEASTPVPCLKAKGVDAPVIPCFIDGLDHAAWSEEAKVVWGFFASLK